MSTAVYHSALFLCRCLTAEKFGRDWIAGARNNKCERTGRLSWLEANPEDLHMLFDDALDLYTVASGFPPKPLS